MIKTLYNFYLTFREVNAFHLRTAKPDGGTQRKLLKLNCQSTGELDQKFDVYCLHKLRKYRTYTSAYYFIAKSPQIIT